MPALITFRDFDPWYKYPWCNPGWLEHNKIGYATDGGDIIYPLRCGLHKAKFASIRRRNHIIIPLPSISCQENIERFFTQNRPNVDLFFRGLTAITERDEEFFDNPIRLPLLETISDEEFNRKWQKFLTLLEVADLIMLIDTTSIVSKAIAAIDHGVWSHIATYTGNRMIIEATTKGVVERSIDVYRLPHYRVGLYRPIGRRELIPWVIAAARSQLGKRYNYRVVFRLAIRKLLKIRPKGIIS